MKNFWKAVGRIAILTIGVKAVAEIIKHCRKCPPCPEPKRTVDENDAKYIPNQLVVWKRPGVSDGAYAQWISENLGKFPEIRRKNSCHNCDSSLDLWEGDDVPTFVSDQVAKGGTTTKTKLRGGGDDVACFTFNLIIDLPEPHYCDPYTREIELPGQAGNGDPAVTVAVFDTGISPLIKSRYTIPVPSCMPLGELGWNFAYENEKTEDDHTGMHGSAVTKFIIDQADIYKRHKLNILPVKTHNKDGKGDLFGILCGFAYAANCGAKIINASFGFYAAKGSEAPVILSEFVRKHLTEKNILLVCAAGNVDADKRLGMSDAESIRNLDIYPFYPACLSKDFQNVITVTTISPDEDEVSQSQSFSNHIVDIGVRCDKEVDSDFRFEDPLNRQQQPNMINYIVGSSYATPIFTGKAAQHYTDLLLTMVDGRINKDGFIQALKNKTPKIVDTNSPSLAQYIVDGNFAVKKE